MEAGALIDEQELSKLHYNKAFITEQFMSLGCKHIHVLLLLRDAVAFYEYHFQLLKQKILMC